MLKKFATFESDEDDDKLFQDLDSIGIEQYKGWLISEAGYQDNEFQIQYVAVVARNVQEAVIEILKVDGFLDKSSSEEDFEIASEVKTWEDYRTLKDDLRNDWGSAFMIESVQEGFIPVRREPYCLIINWVNPVMAVADLKSVFKNVDQVLYKKIV